MVSHGPYPSLVEDHTTRIDRFQENTGDKSRFQGHYFGPLVPTDNPSPLLLYVYPRIVYGFIWSEEKSRNWAMLFGLDGYWVWVPLLVMRTAAAVIAGIRISRHGAAFALKGLSDSVV